MDTVAGAGGGVDAEPATVLVHDAVHLSSSALETVIDVAKITAAAAMHTTRTAGLTVTEATPRIIVGNQARQA